MSRNYVNKLTNKEEEILILLFSYRGLRAKDVVVFFHRSKEYSKSKEKSIYNYLRKLKEKGLVKSARLQEEESRGSLYFLTRVGLEITKSLLDIPHGQQGNGLLPYNPKTTFWDIDYAYQKPPLKQVSHFLLMIEFFTQLVTDQIEPFMHRTTLYSNLTYILKGKVYKVRPDALIHVNNGVYSIEIDLLTETQEQLIEKFQKYKAYLESAASKHGPQLHTILFVLPERVRRYGLKRRWMTILTAFYKVFKEFTDVNLILCSVDELATILEFEQKREQIQQDRITYLSNKCVNEDSYISFSINGQLCLAKDDEYIVLIIQCHHEFEARIYRDYYDLYLAEKEFPLTVRVRKINDDMGLFNFSGYKGQFCTPIRKPEWLEGLENTGIPIHLLEKIKKTHDYINRYRVVNI